MIQYIHEIARSGILSRLSTVKEVGEMKVRKYRKRPVVVEAYQTDREMIIHTLEGDHHASVGDYILTGVKGEQYPCKPDIFAKTYEPVDE